MILHAELYVDLKCQAAELVCHLLLLSGIDLLLYMDIILFHRWYSSWGERKQTICHSSSFSKYTKNFEQYRLSLFSTLFHKAVTYSVHFVKLWQDIFFSVEYLG